MRCCQWQGVGLLPDAADGLMMAQKYLSSVLSMALGWPTSRYCRSPHDGPELLGSRAGNSFELAKLLFKEVMQMALN